MNLKETKDSENETIAKTNKKRIRKAKPDWITNERNDNSVNLVKKIY